MPRTIRMLLLCAAVAVHPSAEVLASEAGDSVTMRHGMVVQDSLLPAARVVHVPDRLPTPRQTLDKSFLQLFAGRSVAEAAGTMAGLQIRDYGGVGGLKTIDVRGMGSAHTSVFCDGMPLANAQNGQVDLGRYAAASFESVGLFHGGASHMLQSARQWASGNSVEMVSRRPDFADTAFHTKAEAGMRTGSFGRLEPTLHWEQQWRRGLALTADATYLHAHGRYPFRLRKTFADGTVAYDTTAVREGGDISAVSMDMCLFGHPESRTKWQAKAHLYASDRGIPAAVVNNVWGSAQRQSDTDAWIQGRWQRTWGDTYTLRLAGKAAVERLHYRNPDTLQLRTDRTFTQPSLYLSSVHRLALGRGRHGAFYECALSVDYAFNSLRQASRWTLPPGSLPHPTRHTLMTAWTGSVVWKKWRTVATLHHTFTSDASDLQPEVRRRQFVAPVVMTAFRPIPDLGFRAMVRRHQRIPTFNELHYHEMGNIQLRPEQCWQYSVGGEWERHFLRRTWTLAFSADIFMHRITDKIVAVPRGSGQWRWMMLNVGEVLAHGTDLKGKVVWHATATMNFEVNAHYSYNRSEDRSNPDDNDPRFGTFKGQIPYLPRHAGGLSAQYTFSSFTLLYVWSGVGCRYRSSANTPANRLQPWQTHDLTLLCTLPHVSWLQLSAACYNVAGRQYEVVPNYPMPRRNFLIGIRMTWQR